MAKYSINSSLVKTVEGLDTTDFKNLYTNESDIKKLLASVAYIPTGHGHDLKEKIRTEALNNIEFVPDHTNGKMDIFLNDMDISRHIENFNKLVESVLLCYGINDFKNTKLTGTKRIEKILEENQFFKDRLGYEKHAVISGWGSHRGSTLETLDRITDLSKENAEYNNVLYITGGGADVMEAVLKGAYKTEQNWPLWGFNEPGIVAVEPPNKYVGFGKLVIFPNIDERKLAFILASHGLQQFEGGVGTQEELMDFLQILLHEKNKDVPYLYDIILHDKKYYKVLKNFLCSFLTKEQFSEKLDMHLKPTINSFVSGMRTKIGKKLPEKKPFFQKNLYVPEHMFENDEAESSNFYELLSNLDLTMNQDQQSLIKNLGKFFNYFVSLTVKVPEQPKKWLESGDLPVIKIDKEIKKSLEDLISLFIEQKRVYIKKEDIFYRFEPV